MTCKKRLLICWLPVVVIAAAGIVAYMWFFGGPEQFDARFYAQGQTVGSRPSGYGDYAAALEKYVDEKGMVDYAGLKENRARLDRFALALARLDRKTYDDWDRSARIAFWTNAYNALTLKVILDNYPIRPNLLRSVVYPSNSIRQIPGVWDKVQFLVMGRKVTLDHIEHGILRKEFDEPRIHMALVCAAMGCPPLRNEPYDGKRLNEQLDDQTRKFLADPAKFKIDRDSGKVRLSSIFNWFGGDFVKKYKPPDGYGSGSDAERAVLNFISKFLPPQQARFLRQEKHTVKYLEYDWSLNEWKGAPKRAAKQPAEGSTTGT